MFELPTENNKDPPTLNGGGRGGVRIILFSEVTLNYVVTDCTNVGLFNGYWQNNAEGNAEVDLLPIEVCVLLKSTVKTM